MSHKDKEIYQENLKNYLSSNQSDRNGGSYLAADGIDLSAKRITHQNDIYSNIENTNWDKESNYHNTYRVNGKYNIGRTITLSKKKK